MMSTALGKRPNIYVYDHCPFCVRARMILGLKGVPHQLTFLDNDDIETPMAMVGKKVVPILEMTDTEGKAVVMPESMDIVKRVDEDSRWGPPLLKPATNREDIKLFFESIADLSRRCTRPRFALSSVLPEFHTPAARAAFVKNHPFKSAPFDYTENLINTKLVSELSERLKELDGLIFSKECVTEGGVSYDDIDLFGKTRGLTVVKGLLLPPKLEAYLECFAEKTEIPLYHQMEL